MGRSVKLSWLGPDSTYSIVRLGRMRMFLPVICQNDFRIFKFLIYLFNIFLVLRLSKLFLTEMNQYIHHIILLYNYNRLYVKYIFRYF